MIFDIYININQLQKRVRWTILEIFQLDYKHKLLSQSFYLYICNFKKKYIRI